MKFQILDDNGNSILGTIEGDNVYLTTYASYPLKTHNDIEVGETTSAHFNLSSEHGFYHVRRIS